mmetsp:Transcript_33740/g.51747  ORF Transcript_33740/g.51747 Transcript_33740/m.51747 type:complete len:257 (+) Transcript_33740:1230-2000(+)
MCRYTLKHLKIGWEGLGCASWIIDNDINTSTGCQTKGHGHAVIVVGFDQYIVVYFVVGGRSDDTIITKFFNRCSQFGTFCDDCFHAFCFLQSPGINITDSGWSFSKECCNCQSHGSIWDFVTINVYTLELHIWVPCDCNTIWSPGDGGSHLFHDVGKGNISLDTFRSTSTHCDSSSGNSCSSNEVTSRTSISFHKNGFRTLVCSSRRNEKGRFFIEVTGDLHVDAKFLHQSNRECNIGGRNEFVFDGDCYITSRKR